MKTFLKSIRNLLHRPPVACMFISMLVFAAVVVLWANGLMQRPELIAYDYLVAKRMKPDSVDDRMVLIGMTERDLKKYGYPLPDDLLAEVLQKIGSQEIDSQKPAVIGMDLYRDLPEPRNRAHYPELERALKQIKSVIAIQRVGFVDGPPALYGPEDVNRISVNNLPKDSSIDGMYRRGLLIYENGRDDYMESFSLAVTRTYLEKMGIPCGMGEDGVYRIGSTEIPRLTSSAGGYVNPLVAHYEYLADFESPRRFRIQDPNARPDDDQSGKDNTPHDFSFQDVLEDKVPAGALAGKIVFVATVMQTIKDSNPTPIHDNLRGVQMHMMCTHQLLDIGLKGRKPMAWWPDWAELMCVAVAALAGGVLGLFLHSPWRFAPALALLLAVIGGAGVWAFHGRIWIPFVTPILACAVSAALVLSVVAYFESLQRGMMKKIFSKHVSSAVVERVMEEPDLFLAGGRLKPQRVVATVIFTDLKGFSTTSEKMDPATLMDWMNDYFNGIASKVDENGGMIDKFIGDAIMGVFGVPRARTTEEGMDADARNAVECALAMRGALMKLNAEWRAEGRPTTAMRVGIHTGWLVCGNVGSDERLDFTVLGDTVNTAARLEGAGKDFGEDEGGAECTILISDATCARLANRYVTRLLGALSLKGKADKVVVHSVIARNTSALEK